ncbi:MAG: leucyl aminopeptidase [Campylobacterales bacterium]|nr:leucyl aminopeptidase [Campylobacterales bacterium]
MKIELKDKKIKEIDAQLEIIFVVNKDWEHAFVQDAKELKKLNFDNCQDTTALVVGSDRLYVATDDLKSYNLRTAAAKAMKAIKATAYTTIKVASYIEQDETSIQAMVEGFVLGAYMFEKYKSEKSKNKTEAITISTQSFNTQKVNETKAKEAIQKAIVIAYSTNFTRDIVNTTPDDCYPEVMADIAQDLAKECGLQCTILKPNELKEQKMETLLAVARASRHKPRVIHLSHKPKNPKAVISIVGKGLTYDSGGLSLKPSEHMVTMKADKSGGSAVLGILRAVAKLDLPIEVHGFVGAVENMIGGDAYKPDDVLVSKSGKTIEVRNTDAEGRLVLADVLAYAQQEVKADFLFDMATLTGACVVGVGEYTIGAMSNHSQTAQLVLDAAKEVSGELVTQLHFNRYLKATLKSNIADICNISNTRYGGAVTAGLFLSEFIDENHKDKWVHLDIAGPSFVEHEWGENPVGASGAGVRLMVATLQSLLK